MSETKTIQVQGFSEGAMLRDGGWMEFHINVGRQYPLKLSTKQPDVQALATAAGKNQAIWTYGETEGNPNPHRPGENYKNRYLNNVEVGGTLDPTLAGQQQLPGTQGGGQAPALAQGRSTTTDRSIERQVIVKSAMYLYPAGLITSDEEWFALIHKLDDFMVKTTTAAPPVEAPPVTGQFIPAGDDAAPVNPDDDIPF